MDAATTLCGNLVAAPELRFTKEGKAFLRMRMAHTPRRFDPQSREWHDGDSLFITVRCWRSLAENVASSLVKGDPVVVVGRLVQRSWGEGEERRTVVEVDAEAIGPDLSRGTVKFQRTRRSGASAGDASTTWAEPTAAADPWASAPAGADAWAGPLVASAAEMVAAEARMAVAEAGLAADPDDRAGGPAVSTAGATGPGDDAGDRGAFNEDGEGDAGSAGAAA